MSIFSRLFGKSELTQDEKLADKLLAQIRSVSQTVEQLQQCRLSGEAAEIVAAMQTARTSLLQAVGDLGPASQRDRRQVVIDTNRISQSTDELLELLKRLAQRTSDPSITSLLSQLDDRMSSALMTLMMLQLKK
jgi:hypothetical protein